MRTITETYKVYSFDELSEEAKEKAHTDYLCRGSDEWPWIDDARSTIKEVEKLFNIELNNWSIGLYRPEYPDIEFDDWWYNCWNEPSYTLCGNRARAFLWNNFGHVLTSPRRKYFCHDKNGKRFEAVGDNCISIKSNIFTTRVYDGTCPLTGVCFDCDALDPMAYFCFGVEWNEKEKKRTMTKDRILKHDNRTTVEDVIRDCVHSMFRSFNEDCEHYFSMDGFKETCEANDWEFEEDGTMYW